MIRLTPVPYFAWLLLVVSLALAGCATDAGPNHGDPPSAARRSELSPGAQPSACAVPAADPEQPASDFLPLSTGNRWTYRKTVTRPVRAWEAYGAIGGDSVTLALGSPPDMEAGQMEETYTVRAAAHDVGPGLWEIEVSDPKARDGRYGSWFTRPSRVVWGRVPSSAQIIEIDEILIRAESYFEDEKRHRAVLLAQPLVDKMEVTLQSLESIRFMVAQDLVTVQVPAGSFPCSLVVATVIESDQETGGWTTYSYYARDVGLVKEWQVDSQADTTYVMELVSYAVR